MQAWQQVQVKNEDSVYHGQAGLVVRVEANDGQEHAFVRMDSDETVQPFDASELTVLG
jgi:hypothetical protein